MKSIKTLLTEAIVSQRLVPGEYENIIKVLQQAKKSIGLRYDHTSYSEFAKNNVKTPKDNPYDLGKLLLEKIQQINPNITKDTLKVAANSKNVHPELNDMDGLTDCLLYFVLDKDYELGGGINIDILYYTYGMHLTRFGKDQLDSMYGRSNVDVKLISVFWATTMEYFFGNQYNADLLAKATKFVKPKEVQIDLNIASIDPGEAEQFVDDLRNVGDATLSGHIVTFKP